jgi:hypothetical protein
VLEHLLQVLQPHLHRLRPVGEVDRRVSSASSALTERLTRADWFVFSLATSFFNLNLLRLPNNQFIQRINRYGGIHGNNAHITGFHGCRRSATGEPCAFIEEIAAQRMRLDPNCTRTCGHVSHL